MMRAAVPTHAEPWRIFGDYGVRHFRYVYVRALGGWSCRLEWTLDDGRHSCGASFAAVDLPSSATPIAGGIA